MQRLGKYIKPYGLYITFTMLIKLGATGVELLIPFFMEMILDDVVPAGNKKGIFIFGGLMLFCSLTCLALNIIANRMSAVSSGKITRKLRYDLFAKLEGLSAKQLDGLTVSSAESRLTSDTYNVNQMLARVQRLGVRAPILLVGGIAMMLGMDAVLALILVAMLPLIALIVYIVTKKSIPLYKYEQSVLDRMVRVLSENITGIRVIKALSRSEHEKTRFEDVNSELTSVDRKAGMLTAVTNPATSLVLNIGLTAVVLLGAFRVNGGFGKSGVIIAFLQYFVMILNAMLGITRIFVMWSKGQASALRIADVLQMGSDLDTLPASSAGSDAAIEFRNVSFSHNGVGKDLDSISFKLMPGETLGILGPTGSGKSTLLSLLMRTYDADEGTVFVGGKDVREWDRAELLSKFGAAFQNDFVMEGTIGENIGFFRDIPEDELRRASRDAQADEFIALKENGFDSYVAVRGNNLSGGQKQRLLIARALASDPDILVLDDASSALDYRTDADLRRAIASRGKKRTVVTVAQRVSSVRGCDRILVLSDGKTVGFGTHDELMENCPEYRFVAESQMGSGKEAV